MTPQDLLYVQAKIANSFLKAFYPTDYRAVQKEESKAVKAIGNESIKIQKTEKLTGDLNRKLARVLGLMEKEVSDMMDSLDRVQVTAAESPISVDLETLSNSLPEASSQLFGLFDIWRTLRSARKGIEEGRKKPPKAEQPKTEPPKTEPKPETRPTETRPSTPSTPPTALEPPKVESPGIMSRIASMVSSTAEAVSGVVSGLGKVIGISFVLAIVAEAVNTIRDLIPIIKIYKTVPPEQLRNLLLEVVKKHALAFAQFAQSAIIFAIFLWVLKHALAGLLRRMLVGTTVAAASGVLEITIGLAEIGIAVWAGVMAVWDLYEARGDLSEIVNNPPSPEDIVDFIMTILGVDTSQATPVTPTQSSVPAVPSLSPITPAQAEAPVSGELPATAAQLAAAVQPPPPATAPIRQQLPAATPAPAPVAAPDLAPPQTDVLASLDPNVIQRDIQQRVQTNSQEQEPEQTNGITPQESVSNTDVKVIEAYGSHRPGRPVQKIRDIAVKAAEKAGMSQITFTSGVGDWISSKRRDAGQKSTRHALGDALDVTGFETASQRIAFMQAARQFGAGGIGSYGDGSVHIDLGPSREWDGAVGVAGLADGGKVHPREGGTLALIGEAGEPEYVVPQSKVTKFAHEMLATRPRNMIKNKKHTHIMVVPIYT